jgi:hypothetical protein
LPPLGGQRETRFRIRYTRDDGGATCLITGRPLIDPIDRRGGAHSVRPRVVLHNVQIELFYVAIYDFRR